MEEIKEKKQPEKQADVKSDNAPIVRKSSKMKLLPIFLGLALLIAIPLGFFLLKERQNSVAISVADQAIVAYKNGDLATLKRKLTEALAVSPHNPKLLAALIQAYAVEGNQNGSESQSFEAAQPYVKEALALKPESAEVFIAVGYLYETDSKYQDALTFYNKGLVLDSKSAQGLFHKGHVLEFLNDVSGAREAYDKAYTLNPKDPLIALSLAKYKLIDGKSSEALSIYKTIAILDSATADQKAEALTNASIITRSNLSQINDAVALTAEATKLSPSYSPALGNHGYNLALSGDSTQAIVFLEKAIVANPRISQNYWYMGLVYRAVKNYSYSISLQEQGLQKFDNDNTILGDNRAKTKGLMLYNLAQTYSKNNNIDKVVPTLQLALEQNSNLKSKIKKDFETYGDFKEVGSSVAFQKLIQ